MTIRIDNVTGAGKEKATVGYFLLRNDGNRIGGGEFLFDWMHAWRIGCRTHIFKFEDISYGGQILISRKPMKWA